MMTLFLLQKASNTHDVAVPALTQPQELVVLADDMDTRLRKVESERDLRRAEIVHGEQNFVGQEAFVAPDRPTHTGISKSIYQSLVNLHDQLYIKTDFRLTLMSASINGAHMRLWQIGNRSIRMRHHEKHGIRTSWKSQTRSGLAKGATNPRRLHQRGYRPRALLSYFSRRATGLFLWYLRIGLYKWCRESRRQGWCSHPLVSSIGGVLCEFLDCNNYGLTYRGRRAPAGWPRIHFLCST